MTLVTILAVTCPDRMISSCESLLHKVETVLLPLFEDVKRLAVCTAHLMAVHVLFHSVMMHRKPVRDYAELSENPTKEIPASS